MNFRSMAALACSVAALGACATGGGERQRRHDSEPIRALLSADVMLFVGFDTDGDLNVSSSEIDAGIAREFTRADTNHDGQLQPIEFQNWSAVVLGGSQLGPYRLDFDRNVDNVITRDEFATEIHGRARDYDTDENGALSRSEFVRLVGQARPPARRQMTPPPIGQQR
jgi:EF hand